MFASTASFFGTRMGGTSRRFGAVLMTLLGLLAMTFFIGRVMPLDPVLAVVGPDADSSTYDQVYQAMGLDRPLLVQFGYYLRDLAQGDFGNALLTGHPVIEDIARVFPATIELATLAIIFGVVLGLPLGVFAAANQGRMGDHLARVVTLFGYSTPIFWLGMMGLLVFYAWLGWAGGAGRIDLAYDGMVPSVTGMLLIDSAIAGDWEAFSSALKHILLPALILGLNSVAYISRMTRSFMLEQLSQEYILTARVKGLSRRKVIWGHAFRNILVQLLTVVALAYGSLLEGAVLIETVFAWPGFGQYLTSSLLLGDMNAVMGCVLVIGFIFVGLNLLSDALYKVFDPRTR
ncbi:Dipeptide transport system permease protein DppB [Pseudomonas sp. Bi70]|jgi:peptide/nickel transport system permease protein|uniref:ABC transporter permease n=1 Tax=unclassified Pseudomonas TaxID=196821 RepID=UPI000DAEA043|nr:MULTISPECIES: ABC transporter permease [unclassified Pseudomonas]MBD9653682.1 ABC transporter permease [Pseudomonas sp. PDM12]MDF2796472.1 binding-protein-dependent transport system inner rane component [Pseudomonas orientalis]PZW49811.1 peptide/nickel transport system permease protein [Pseudomonas sp. URMO17WK12:I2]CAH0282672.1 Dipeptide transport system permease protein DppB [Pseudomonas sp. Bi70]